MSCSRRDSWIIHSFDKHVLYSIVLRAHGAYSLPCSFISKYILHIYYMLGTGAADELGREGSCVTELAFRMGVKVHGPR